MVTERVSPRATAAYRALVGDDDPAAGLGAGADLRPVCRAIPAIGSESSEPLDPTHGGALIVAGADDLAEIRSVVERSTGVGTWWTPVGPDALSAAGLRLEERATASVAIDRPGPVLALVMALEGAIEDRSPWRTWRTAVDTLAEPLAAVRSVTIVAERWVPRSFDAIRASGQTRV